MKPVPACTCDKALAGGPERFGFPDDGYCQRVLEDLRGGWIYLDTFAVMKVFHVVEAVTLSIFIKKSHREMNGGNDKHHMPQELRENGVTIAEL